MMRRLYTAEGNLDVEQLRLPNQPDEILLERTKKLQERLPHLTFTQAKREELRKDPALAKAYAEQFS